MVFQWLRRVYNEIEDVTDALLDNMAELSAEKHIPMIQMAMSAKAALAFADELFQAAMVIQSSCAIRDAYLVSANHTFPGGYTIPTVAEEDAQAMAAFAEVADMFEREKAMRIGKRHAKSR